MKIDTFFIFNQFVNYKLATNQSPTSLVLQAFDPFGAKSSVTIPCSNDLLTTFLMASASDFNNKVSLVSNKKIIEMTNTGEYQNFPQRLIIYISKPLMLDSKKALISFSVISMPFNPISHFSKLMINENNKWVQSASYFDGIYY